MAPGGTAWIQNGACVLWCPNIHLSESPPPPGPRTPAPQESLFQKSWAPQSLCSLVQAEPGSVARIQAVEMRDVTLRQVTHICRGIDRAGHMCLKFPNPPWEAPTGPPSEDRNVTSGMKNMKKPFSSQDPKYSRCRWITTLQRGFNCILNTYQAANLLVVCCGHFAAFLERKREKKQLKTDKTTICRDTAARFPSGNFTPQPKWLMLMHYKVVLCPPPLSAFLWLSALQEAEKEAKKNNQCNPSSKPCYPFIHTSPP